MKSGSSSDLKPGDKEEKEKQQKDDEDSNLFLKILNQKVTDLNNDLKQARENYRIFKEILNSYDLELFAEVLRITRKKANVLTRILQNESDFGRIYEKIISTSKKECIKLLKKYPQMVAEACKRHNIVIDSSSAHPRYMFHKGFIILTIDESKYEAKCVSREGKLFSVSFDISIVVETLKREINRIFNRDFNPNQFIEILYTEYSDIILAEKKKIGEPLQIKNLLTSLQNKKVYARKDEFNVDLSRLLIESKNLISDFGLELIHTKNIKEGILLYNFDTYGYVGYIKFKGDKT